MIAKLNEWTRDEKRNYPFTAVHLFWSLSAKLKCLRSREREQNSSSVMKHINPTRLTETLEERRKSNNIFCVSLNAENGMRERLESNGDKNFI